MASKLFFAFIFFIKLFISVVPLSAHPTGFFEFGDKLENEKNIGYINIQLPRLKPEPHDGINRYTFVIDSPNKERIYRVELQSWLRNRSEKNGAKEEVQLVAFTPHRDAVSLMFTSLPYHGIFFTAKMYGLID